MIPNAASISFVVNYPLVLSSIRPSMTVGKPFPYQYPKASLYALASHTLRIHLFRPGWTCWGALQDGDEGWERGGGGGGGCTCQPLQQIVRGGPNSYIAETWNADGVEVYKRNSIEVVQAAVNKDVAINYHRQLPSVQIPPHITICDNTFAKTSNNVIILCRICYE
jgi:hypothetical protein